MKFTVEGFEQVGLQPKLGRSTRREPTTTDEVGKADFGVTAVELERLTLERLTLEKLTTRNSQV